MYPLRPYSALHEPSTRLTSPGRILEQLSVDGSLW